MRLLLLARISRTAGWKSRFLRRSCFLAGIVFTACTASYYRYHTSIELRLAKVEPSGWMSGAKGGADSTVYEFHDHHARFQWAVGGDARLDFVLDNLSADTIHVLWEQARYVDERLDSHRVFHAGVKMADRNQPRPTVPIKPSGKLVDFILPEHLIVENPLHAGELLPEQPLLSLRDSNPRQLRREANALRGRQVQVVLPIAVKGAITRYRFTFQVTSVSIR